MYSTKPFVNVKALLRPVKFHEMQKPTGSCAALLGVGGGNILPGPTHIPLPNHNLEGNLKVEPAVLSPKFSFTSFQ